MNIDRDELSELVGIFYPSPYKIFYVNSTDGLGFEKPSGIFISLGLTTSPRIMESIRDIINSSKLGTAEISEIASRKMYGQFMNYLTESNPTQYKLQDYPEGVMDKEESINLLTSLQDLVTDEQQLELLRETVPKVNKLKAVIEKIDSIPGGWDSHSVHLDEAGNFRVYHKYVNYEKDTESDIEYRIGIFVKSI